MGLFTDTCVCGHSILNHETGGCCRAILVFSEAGLRVCRCPVYRDAAHALPTAVPDDELAVFRAAFADEEAW